MGIDGGSGANRHQCRVPLTLLCSDHVLDTSQIVLAVGLDSHVRGRVRHAREAEALPRLVLVQEGLVRLVDLARQHLARAARARARAAGVGQLEALLLGLVEDVHVLGALELLGAVRRLQRHLEVRGDALARRDGAQDGRGSAGGEGAVAARHGPALAVDRLREADLWRSEGLARARGEQAAQRQEAQGSHDGRREHAGAEGHGPLGGRQESSWGEDMAEKA
mmetsp:Transcript_14776/g.39421  ORF Transcript_14776/g.39421 Transcript_14776/m.39421 type:complete len:222 (+) Transcript_14776:107-772(+)